MQSLRAVSYLSKRPLIVFFLFGISLRRRSKSSARYVTISCAVGNGLLLLLLPLEDDAAKVDRALDRAAR